SSSSFNPPTHKILASFAVNAPRAHAFASADLTPGSQRLTRGCRWNICWLPLVSGANAVERTRGVGRETPDRRSVRESRRLPFNTPLEEVSAYDSAYSRAVDI